MGVRKHVILSVVRVLCLNRIITKLNDIYVSRFISHLCTSFTGPCRILISISHILSNFLLFSQLIVNVLSTTIGGLFGVHKKKLDLSRPYAISFKKRLTIKLC